MNKVEYKHEMDVERKFYDHSLKAFLLRYDSYYIAEYLKVLRWAEWYDRQPGVLNKVLCGWYKYRLRNLGRMFGFQIGLHACGFGLKFYHWGPIIVNSNAKIGQGG